MPIQPSKRSSLTVPSYTQFGISRLVPVESRCKHPELESESEWGMRIHAEPESESVLDSVHF